MTYADRTKVLDAVRRASQRSAAAVHGEMKRGLHSLASIAVTAALVGVFGTVIGINNSFRGIGTERATVLALEAEGLSEALVPAALGILIAVVAFCSYKFLLAKLGDFDVEMENASLQLVNDLGSADIWRTPAGSPS